MKHFSGSVGCKMDRSTVFRTTIITNFFQLHQSCIQLDELIHSSVHIPGGKRLGCGYQCHTISLRSLQIGFEVKRQEGKIRAGWAFATLNSYEAHRVHIEGFTPQELSRSHASCKSFVVSVKWTRAEKARPRGVYTSWVRGRRTRVGGRTP